MEKIKLRRKRSFGFVVAKKRFAVAKVVARHNEKEAR